MATQAKYLAAHASPNGPTDARPSALQIIEDDGLVGKLKDKVALITGTSSGIGIETARALAATGAKVYCTARSISKGEAALKGILEPGRVELLEVDQNSLASVRALAKNFLSKSNKLNILVNNAGIMMTPEGRTVDGFESQFGVNHLSHFLLFNLLKDTLITSSTPDFQSRVVDVSSTGHRMSKVHLDNHNLEGIYQPHLSYGQAKTANIWMANQIERLYGSQGVHGFSLHPGGIWTGLQIHMGEDVIAAYKKDENVNKHMKNLGQGAATQVWAAVAKELEGKGGLYLEDCKISEPVKEGYSVIDQGHEKWAYDEEGEKQLWALSERLVGLA